MGVLLPRYTGKNLRLQEFQSGSVCFFTVIMFYSVSLTPSKEFHLALAKG